MPSNWYDTRDSWACLICRIETHLVMNLGHLWERVVFPPLFTGKKDPAFSNIYECMWFWRPACVPHVFAAWAKRENRSDLIPVSHGNPHPTCILSQRIRCNGHIYHNLYNKGHISQEVESIYTWINLTCLKKRWNNNIKLYVLILQPSITPFSLWNCLELTWYFPGSKNKQPALYSAFLLGFHVVLCSLKLISITLNETSSTCHISPSGNATNCKIIQSCVNLNQLTRFGWPGYPASVNSISLGLVSSNNMVQVRLTFSWRFLLQLLHSASHFFICKEDTKLHWP